jgi:hypothetical protein
MDEATALKSKESRSFSMSSPTYKMFPNPPISSRVIKGFLYTNLRSLNARHFGLVEATR